MYNELFQRPHLCRVLEISSPNGKYVYEDFLANLSPKALKLTPTNPPTDDRNDYQSAYLPRANQYEFSMLI